LRNRLELLVSDYECPKCCFSYQEVKEKNNSKRALIRWEVISRPCTYIEKVNSAWDPETTYYRDHYYCSKCSTEDTHCLLKFSDLRLWTLTWTDSEVIKLPIWLIRRIYRQKGLI
jgi:hypothetical protein